jgi:hypothetical protein
MKKKFIATFATAVLIVTAVWYWGFESAVSQLTENMPSEQISVMKETVSIAQADEDTTVNQPDSGTPKIYFPETFYDFGSIPQGEKVTHTFVVKNIGDAPLKIISAKGS